jgi:hypothetical protein
LTERNGGIGERSVTPKYEVDYVALIMFAAILVIAVALMIGIAAG